jgi:hypothetical protein
MISTRTCELLYDSSKAMVQLGGRSGLAAERSLVFCDGDVTIDVVLHGGSERMRYVHGQVISQTGEPVAGATVSMEDTGPVDTDLLGQFALSTLDAAGDAKLRIEHGETKIVCKIPREATT